MAVTEINMWLNAHRNPEDRYDFSAWYAVELDFFRAALEGPVYIRINGKSRNGTIGIVDYSRCPNVFTREEYAAARAMGREAFLNGEKWKFAVDDLFGREKSDWSEAKPAKTWEEYIEQRRDATDFDVRMDDGRMIKLPSSTFDTYNHERDSDRNVTFTWLKGYEGPSVFKFTKVAKEVHQAKAMALPRMTDRLEQEVKLGDLAVATVGYDMLIGNVVKLSETGKSIMFKAFGATKAIRIVGGAKLLVINDTTRTAAAIYKLEKFK